MGTPMETPKKTPNRYSGIARLAIQVKDKEMIQTLLWRVSLSSFIKQYLYFSSSNTLVLPWSLLYLFYLVQAARQFLILPNRPSYSPMAGLIRGNPVFGKASNRCFFTSNFMHLNAPLDSIFHHRIPPIFFQVKIYSKKTLLILTTLYY